MNGRRFAAMAGFAVLIVLPMVLFSAGGGDALYEPNKRSLNKHPVPEWFDDAKFGIFIHWSLSSVPAFAPVSDKKIWEISAEGGVGAQLKYNPYAEWYLNTMRIEGSPTQEYHRETYGDDFSYFDFAPMFTEQVKKWDPGEWAGLFKEAGARYVVLVTKHHDGFLLWPSEMENPFHEEYYSGRDLVGELTSAVKSEGMRMGFYYSGGLDWTFQTVPISDAASYLTNGPATDEYADYVEFHFRELMDRYQPDILWNDICYPPDGDYFEIVADFYNDNPDGVVNDRWARYPKAGRKAMMSRPLRDIINWAGDLLMTSDGLSSPLPPHADFTTPEYASYSEIKKKKWESTRGIGNSFGYNRMETEEHYLKSDEAVRMLVDIVSKNGNLLLNVGPRPDGSIPDGQVKCILGMGRWLATNGEAIYGGRPWVTAEGKTECGVQIRFTEKDDALYAILMDTPDERRIEIIGIKAAPDTEIRMLGNDSILSWSQNQKNLEIELPEK